MLYEVMQTRSVENNRQRFAVSRLTVRAVKKIIFSPDERKQQVGDKQDLGRRNHESYCEVEVGVSAAGIDPEVPQNWRHYDADTEHYRREKRVAGVGGQVAPQRQQR